MSTHVDIKPQDTKPQDTKPQYDSFASDYVSMEHLPSEIIAANLVRRTVSEIPRTRKLKVLDLACGTGRYARVLLDLGIADHIIGVDLSSEMVRVGRELEPEHMTFHVADCTKPLDALGLEKCSFDLVLGNWLLNYAADQEELSGMWSNISTYLKPGGYFVGLLPIFDTAKLLSQSSWNGITFRQIASVRDGIKVTVTAHCRPQIEFDNYLLDRRLHEEIPKEMGMSGVRWDLPDEGDLPSMLWVGLADAGEWKEYLRGGSVSHVCVAVKALE